MILMTKRQILIRLCTAVLMLCVALFSILATGRPAAYYYPIKVESYTAGDFDQLRIRKVYQLSISDNPARIPTEDFEKYNRTFHLMEMTQKTEAGANIYTTTFCCTDNPHVNTSARINSNEILAIIGSVGCIVVLFAIACRRLWLSDT